MICLAICVKVVGSSGPLCFDGSTVFGLGIFGILAARDGQSDAPRPPYDDISRHPEVARYIENALPCFIALPDTSVGFVGVLEPTPLQSI